MEKLQTVIEGGNINEIISHCESAELVVSFLFLFLSFEFYYHFICDLNQIQRKLWI